jgi:flavin reductase (DIM6/NTAB) family NADH-FMN oxidoreductase RutF
MPIDERAYKDALARWTSGVTVLTTVHEGQWKGATVSSFTSASLRPPLVLVCLAQALYTHTLVSASGVFAVNILRHDQIELGQLFAGMRPEITDRFAYGDWHWQVAPTGSPVLTEAMGWLDCRTVHAYPAGDHTIFVGEVQAIHVGSDGVPLSYFNRRWGRFSADES